MNKHSLGAAVFALAGMAAATVFFALNGSTDALNQCASRLTECSATLVRCSTISTDVIEIDRVPTSSVPAIRFGSNPNTGWFNLEEDGEIEAVCDGVTMPKPLGVHCFKIPAWNKPWSRQWLESVPAGSSI